MSALIFLELTLLTRITGAALAAVALTRSIDAVAAVSTWVKCTIIDVLVAVLALVTRIADTIKPVLTVLTSAVIATRGD